jgi:hypothetical protein
VTYSLIRCDFFPLRWKMIHSAAIHALGCGAIPE